MIDFEALRRVQSSGDVENWLSSVIGSPVGGIQHSAELSDSYTRGGGTAGPGQHFTPEHQRVLLERLKQQGADMKRTKLQSMKQQDDLQWQRMNERARMMDTYRRNDGFAMGGGIGEPRTSSAQHQWQRTREQQEPNKVFPWMGDRIPIGGGDKEFWEARDRQQQMPNFGLSDVLPRADLMPPAATQKKQPVAEWTGPEGRTYLGNKPPPGSVKTKDFTTPPPPKKKPQKSRLVGFHDREGNYHARNHDMTFEQQWRSVHDKMGYARK